MSTLRSYWWFVQTSRSAFVNKKGIFRRMSGLFAIWVLNGAWCGEYLNLRPRKVKWCGQVCQVSPWQSQDPHPCHLFTALSIRALLSPLSLYNCTGLISTKSLRLSTLKQIYATDTLWTDVLNDPNQNLFTFTIYLSSNLYTSILKYHNASIMHGLLYFFKELAHVLCNFIQEAVGFLFNYNRLLQANIYSK